MNPLSAFADAVLPTATRPARRRRVPGTLRWDRVAELLLVPAVFWGSALAALYLVFHLSRAG